MICTLEWTYDNRSWLFGVITTIFISVIGLFVKKNTDTIKKLTYNNIDNNEIGTFNSGETIINNTGYTLESANELIKFIDNKLDEEKRKVNDKISELFNAIPLENRLPERELPLNIIKPAMTLAVVNADNALLKDLLYNIIQSAMTKNVARLVQPAFVEISKMLSQVDVYNLMQIRRYSMCPIADYEVNEMPIQGAINRTILENVVFVYDDDVSNINVYELSSSITNLIRLGLVRRTNRILTGAGVTNLFKHYTNDNIMNQVRTACGKNLEAYEVLRQTVGCQDDIIQIVRKELLEVTNFGHEFIDVSLREQLNQKR